MFEIGDRAIFRLRNLTLKCIILSNERTKNGKIMYSIMFDDDPNHITCAEFDENEKCNLATLEKM